MRVGKGHSRRDASAVYGQSTLVSTNPAPSNPKASNPNGSGKVLNGINPVKPSSQKEYPAGDPL